MSIENNYSYHTGLGPISLTCQSNYGEDLKNLDLFLKCVSQPDSESTSLKGRIKDSFDSGKTLLTRMVTFVQTGVWVNNEAARKVVKHYTKLNDAEKEVSQGEKIEILYDRLAQVKRGNGTYADGICREHIQIHSDPIIEKIFHQALQTLVNIAQDPRTKEALKAVGEVAIDAAVSILTDLAVGYVKKQKPMFSSVLRKNHAQSSSKTMVRPARQIASGSTPRLLLKAK